MALPEYELAGVYGFMRWKEIEGKGFSTASGTTPVAPNLATFGGGTEVDSDNLIYGLWGMDDDEDFTSVQNQLRPVYTFPDGDAFADIPGAFTKGFAPVFNSRTSSRFLLSGGLGDDLPENILAVLNPPPSYKQRLQAIVRETTVTAASFSNIGASLLSILAWDITARDPVGSFFDDADGFEYSVGGALPFLETTPLLRTNGANGEKPEFFPFSNPSEVSAIIDAILAGTFYLPIILSWDVSDAMINIDWPHSAGRN